MYQFACFLLNASLFTSMMSHVFVFPEINVSFCWETLPSSDYPSGLVAALPPYDVRERRFLDKAVMLIHEHTGNVIERGRSSREAQVLTIDTVSICFVMNSSFLVPYKVCNQDYSNFSQAGALHQVCAKVSLMF